MMLEFEECATCRAKPGMISLCWTCFNRRNLINQNTAYVRWSLNFDRTPGGDRRLGPTQTQPEYQRVRFRVQQIYECIGGDEWWQQYEP